MTIAEVKTFLADLKKDRSPEDAALIEKAYNFAEEAHRGQKRASGDPYFSHCVAVTRLLLEMEMDTATVCAGLLHDILEDTAVTFNLLQGEFPEPIPHLVEGVTKISTIRFRSNMEKQAENLRRMILAMAKDIRVIIIKFCDRLHNMRTLQYLPDQKQLIIARDTLDIYAPLANRLGMMQIRSELEDLAMKYLYPDDYQELFDKTRLRAPKRASLIDRTIKILEREIAKRGIHAMIEGRSKHLYGIFQKMRKQNITFEEVYDFTAIRIITDTLELCYDILGLVHSLWRPIPNRFRDFIALPKENQYQSLHTTVVGLEGEATEIQIRTGEMHRVAEYGVAAHWKYKEGKKGLTDIDLRLQWLRQLIEWLKDIPNPGEFIDALRGDVFADIVFCFTPKGDVVELPKGSTPLDFAYHIHTEIGNLCIGARVNKKYVSLKTPLQSGDVVEIITSNHAHPSRDWLDLVQTSRARNKIKHYLKTKELDQYVRIGRDLLQKALKTKGLSLSHPVFLEKLEGVIKSLRENSLDDLLFEIGFGSASASDIAARFGKLEEKPKRKKGKKSHAPGIILHGLDNALVRYSKCCNPIPGDPIIGFVTRGRGISIHKSSCPALMRQKIENSGDSSRIVQVEWDSENLPKCQVNLRVVARDRTGLLKDLSGTISQIGLNVEESHSRVISHKNQAVFRFVIFIDDTKQLNDLLNRIKNVPGVISISRIVRKQDTQGDEK
ncbi:bifunctional (p)ppGpp synthetase/guanosine-3',5'-bis(diphosphate) 3'-pyrophosphohydrolase [Candidatus Sumerlaeota bacterium]|nr:bifunctional (p)ppGpp synthetase/guanosine-3',5'-bis(diphosphate) 3'-pyrophosphohydrolase [Candidatus Sumerlaeota bacterium]